MSSSQVLLWKAFVQNHCPMTDPVFNFFKNQRFLVPLVLDQNFGPIFDFSTIESEHVTPLAAKNSEFHDGIFQKVTWVRFSYATFYKRCWNEFKFWSVKTSMWKYFVLGWMSHQARLHNEEFRYLHKANDSCSIELNN